MTTTLQCAATAGPRRRPALPLGLLGELEHPRDAIAHLTPNWFASVMGTGIVATAAVTLPVRVPGLRAVALLMWALAGVVLIVLLAATAAHWLHHPATARRHLTHPVAGHFYGAPAMAVLTVGAGTLLVGRDVLGLRAAVAVDSALWVVGTLGGLTAAVLVPYLQFVRRRASVADAFGGWLLPVVPPMVSASTGALLAPHAPAGLARAALLLSCYMMFGLALAASLVMIVVIGLRLATRGVGPARAVPTYWIVLGPLGQSVTAGNLFSKGFGVDYGVPVLGLAGVWAVLAAALTVRAARRHLPFSLAWWSFTFPLGTCVTGASGLAAHTGADGFRWSAVSGFLLLAGAWGVVAARTAHGALRGRLLLPAG